jgi:hypothetical protein
MTRKGGNVVEFCHLFFVSLTLQLLWGPLFQPQFTPAEKTIRLGPGCRPTQPLNGSTLSHGGSTHILPTYPAPFQKPSGVKRKAQGVTIKNLDRPSLWADFKSSIDAIAGMSTSKYRKAPACGITQPSAGKHSA